jgi:YhcH/YjgK/YiaL family protein
LTVLLAVVLVSGCVTVRPKSAASERRPRVIFDKLENADRYYGQHPGFRAAFEYLKTQSLDSLTTGRKEIDGARLYALISRDQGRGKAAAKLEAHRKYIDIQYVIAGDEVIGLRPTAECREVSVAYDPAKDIGFFADPPATWVSLSKGTFVVLFPDTAHAPLSGAGEVRKAIVKVAVDW